MGFRPLTEKESREFVSKVQEGIKEDNKKREEDADFLRRVEEVKKAEKEASGSSSAETESLGKEDFSLSEASEASQSMTEVVDASPNVTPSAETKSGENRLGYIAILLILAMIFTVCLQRFVSERRVGPDCGGVSRHGKSLREKRNV